MSLAAATAISLTVLLAASAAARGARPASAPTVLRDAERAADQLDLEKALALAQKGLRAGEAPRDIVCRYYSLIARVAAAMDERALAREYFARLLEIEPTAAVPKSASPKVAEAFRAATAALGSARLSAETSSVRNEGGVVETRVSVTGDLMGLVRGGELHVLPRGPVVPLVTGDGSLAGRWTCTSASCQHSIVLTDAFGNALIDLGSREQPLLTRDAAPFQVGPSPAAGSSVARSATDAPHRPLYLRAWPYLTAAGVAAAAGVVAALSFKRDEASLRSALARPEDYSIDEARRLDDRRRLEHTGMWVAFGASAALGAVAYGVW